MFLQAKEENSFEVYLEFIYQKRYVSFHVVYFHIRKCHWDVEFCVVRNVFLLLNCNKRGKRALGSACLDLRVYRRKKKLSNEREKISIYYTL